MATTQLSGPQRAALVLLALDQKTAREVIQHLEDRDLEQLEACARSLDPVSREAIDPALEALEQQLLGSIPPKGAGAYLQRLTKDAVGEERARRLFQAPEGAREHLGMIRQAKASEIARLLEDEHPQLAAVILSQLTPAQAAQVLNALPASLQGDVLTRVGRLKGVQPQALSVVSEGLARALTGTSAVTRQRRCSVRGTPAP